MIPADFGSPFPKPAAVWALGDGSVHFLPGPKPLNPQPLPPGRHAPM